MLPSGNLTYRWTGRQKKQTHGHEEIHKDLRSGCNLYRSKSNYGSLYVLSI